MQTLEKALRWIVLGGIFILPVVPLVVTTSLFFPYITGKNFMFRVVVELIAAAWLGLALVDPKYRPRHSWILGAFGIFIALIAISDAQGANPLKSFWSNYERMDGWVTIAHLFVYLVVASSVMRTERLWNSLWWTTLTVSFLSSLYGLLQVIGFISLGQGGAAGLSARIDATFGNPIYLAVYMLFHIFIAALLWMRSWQEKSEFRAIASWGYGIVIVLDTIALFLTGTRGTMLGLIGGAVLTVLILAVFGRSRRMRIAAIASVVVVVLLGGALKLGKDSSFVKSVGFLDRLASISTTDTTIASRFTNMSIAWKGVQERPIFGWGQENYAIVFDKYYDPQMYADEPWFDRVHDIIFDWWVAGGTLGLLAYLSIFAATLWALWRRGGFTLQERAVLTGLLAGYFVHNLTVFDNVTSYILFGTVLAYIVYRSTDFRSAAPIPQRAFMATAQLPYTALLAFVVACALVWFVNAPAYNANRALIQAIAPQSDVSVNLDLFKQALSYQSFGQQEIREQLAQGASQIASASGVPQDLKQQFYALATSEMAAQEKVSPLDARFPLFLGVVYDSYGNYTDGATALAHAHALSPTKQEIDFEMGQNAWARGANQEALGDFKAAYDEAPAYTDAQIFYAAAAIRAKDSAVTAQLMPALIASDHAADNRILSAYVAAGQIAQAIPLWQAHIKADPSDAQAYFTLAAIYYNLGEKSQAIATLKAAEVAVPDAASQAESTIQSIQNGTASVQ